MGHRMTFRIPYCRSGEMQDSLYKMETSADMIKQDTGSLQTQLVTSEVSCAEILCNLRAPVTRHQNSPARRQHLGTISAVAATRLLQHAHHKQGAGCLAVLGQRRQGVFGWRMACSLQSCFGLELALPTVMPIRCGAPIQARSALFLSPTKAPLTMNVLV